MHHNDLSENFLKWLENPFSNQNPKQEEIEDSYASIKIPKLGLESAQ